MSELNWEGCVSSPTRYVARWAFGLWIFRPVADATGREMPPAGLAIQPAGLATQPVGRNIYAGGVSHRTMSHELESPEGETSMPAASAAGPCQLAQRAKDLCRWRQPPGLRKKKMKAQRATHQLNGAC